jgi:hypothetical protein
MCAEPEHWRSAIYYVVRTSSQIPAVCPLHANATAKIPLFLKYASNSPVLETPDSAFGQMRYTSYPWIASESRIRLGISRLNWEWQALQTRHIVILHSTASYSIYILSVFPICSPVRMISINPPYKRTIEKGMRSSIWRGSPLRRDYTVANDKKIDFWCDLTIHFLTSSLVAGNVMHIT